MNDAFRCGDDNQDDHGHGMKREIRLDEVDHLHSPFRSTMHRLLPAHGNYHRQMCTLCGVLLKRLWTLVASATG